MAKPGLLECLPALLDGNGNTGLYAEIHVLLDADRQILAVEDESAGGKRQRQAVVSRVCCTIGRPAQD